MHGGIMVVIKQVVTKTGDFGKTTLADGKLVSKSNPRVCALGEIDELNACIGYAVALNLPQPIGKTLEEIQNHLFKASGEIALSSSTRISTQETAMIEGMIESLNANLPPLSGFVRLGGSIPAAQLHIARAVCRRAERTIVKLYETRQASNELVRYMNRLSDLLFVMARVTNHIMGLEEERIKY